MFEIRYSVVLLHILSIISFGYIYQKLGSEHFSGITGDIDYYYFSSTMEATTGLGDILPVTPSAKKVVIVQEVVSLLITSALVLTLSHIKV